MLVLSQSTGLETGIPQYAAVPHPGLLVALSDWPLSLGFAMYRTVTKLLQVSIAELREALRIFAWSALPIANLRVDHRLGR